MKDFDSWNEVKKEIHTKENKVDIKEGAVYWSKFGMNVGNETRGKGDLFKRPVLIIKKFSKDVFFGIPLTSKNKSGNWYFKINKDNKINYLILNQAKLMDRKRLEKKIFQISEKELHKVKLGFCNLILSNNKSRH